tara:strand:- start:897 stop:1172 length:276 start_codon:yes stop_codon:yes gene_type:complete
MSDRSVFGWIATSITFIYKLPQIYKLCKTKSSNDLSITSILIQLLGYIFYALHGLSVNDYPILVMGSVSLLQNITLSVLYFCYKDKIDDEN